MGRFLSHLLAFIACFGGAMSFAPVEARATVGEARTLALATSAVQSGSGSVVVPTNDGWVTDLAHMLTSQEERALEDEMEAYKRGSGHDIALLTVPDLGGRTIEEFGLAVTRGWKLGDVKRQDGALLLVAKSERKMRIEVLDGLEGDLTDAVCSRIIRDTITPEFKAGRFADGIRNGIAEMQTAAGGTSAVVQRSIQKGRAGGSEGSEAGRVIAILIFILMVVVLSRLTRRRGPRGPGGFGGLGRGPYIGGFGGFGGFGGSGGGGGGFGGFGGGGHSSGGGASGGW